MKQNDCCKITPEEQALLDAGDYTPEELFGVGGKPSCPKCSGLTHGWPTEVYKATGLNFKAEHLNSEVMCRGSIQLGTGCRKCSRCFEHLRQQGCPDKTADLELERRALKACGYRVHEKERNGTRWLMACKGLQVQYKHWHPLTSIHQAMQLLQDRDLMLTISYYGASVQGDNLYGIFDVVSSEPTPDHLVLAQCRAIVTACASLEPVR